jgi:hypothetical protein
VVKPTNQEEKHMRYMLLICEEESPTAGAVSDDMSAEYAAFMQEIMESKELVGGERLRYSDTATSVRVRNGKTATTDGPFAETREQLGGYFIVDVTDLDRALALAAKLPAAKTGVVEVRPIWEMG